MKIGIISPGRLPVPPIKGGAVETLIKDLLMENSVKKDLNIDLFSCYDKEIGDTDNIGYKLITVKKSIIIETLNNLIPNSFGRIQRLINKIKDYIYIQKVKKVILNSESNYDFIIIENKPNFIRSFNKILKAKFILHLHNSHIKEYSSHVFENYDCIVTVSKYIKNEILNNHGYISTPIKILYNCVSEEFILSPKISKDIIRKELGFGKNDFIVTFVGRIVEEKGVMELVKAFKLIEDSNIKLMVIGSSWFASEYKTEFVKKLEAEAKDIESKIKFTGYIPHENLANTLQISDTVVLPSIWNEPFGLTIIESMALGKLVITTNRGGIPEIFKGNDGVLLTAENIVSEIAEKVVYYFNNPIERTELERNAIETVNSYYCRNTFYDEFIKILNELKEGIKNEQ
ncbi:glycosyltransferase family 4 protein [Metabacillus indicus]|uniref:glycosyltransferase family 4 protein n=1 Tax=Metabacillus indicus TaxID=246786 RepID=UPI003983FAFE